MPDELGQLLAECEIDDGGAAKERATEEALRRLTTSAPPAPPRRHRLAIAACAVAVIVGFGFTPPGSAIAEDISELIGIGDEPSDDFDFGRGEEAHSSDEVVGLGTTPGGTPFEFAENTNRTPGDPAEGDLTCVYISYPDSGLRPSAASCLTDAAIRGFENGNVIQPVAFLGPGALGPESDLIVSLTATAEVARVEVAYPDDGEGQVTEATIAPFLAAPAQSAEKLANGATPRGETPLVAGAAFLPSTMFRRLPPPSGSAADLRLAELMDLRLDPEATQELLSRIEVTAYDAEGNVLETENLNSPNGYIGIANEIKPEG